MAGWNEWVLGYGARRQRDLLAMFGLNADSLSGLALGMLAGVGFLLGVLALAMARRRAVRLDPVAKIYRRFCRRLERAGVARRPSEGPVDFARRVVAARPQLRDSVERITALYVALRYADGDARVADFRRAVGAFRPR